jgi:hypothetical protein
MDANLKSNHGLCHWQLVPVNSITNLIVLLFRNHVPICGALIFYVAPAAVDATLKSSQIIKNIYNNLSKKKFFRYLSCYSVVQNGYSTVEILYEWKKWNHFLI